MHKLMLFLVVAPFLGGCIVHTHDRRPRERVIVRERSCPPAHHWEGGVCVHNGRARGHRK